MGKKAFGTRLDFWGIFGGNGESGHVFGRHCLTRALTGVPTNGKRRYMAFWKILGFGGRAWVSGAGF